MEILKMVMVAPPLVKPNLYVEMERWKKEKDAMMATPQTETGAAVFACARAAHNVAMDWLKAMKNVMTEII